MSPYLLFYNQTKTIESAVAVAELGADKGLMGSLSNKTIFSYRRAKPL